MIPRLPGHSNRSRISLLLTATAPVRIAPGPAPTAARLELPPVSSLASMLRNTRCGPAICLGGRRLSGPARYIRRSAGVHTLNPRNLDDDLCYLL